MVDHQKRFCRPSITTSATTILWAIVIATSTAIVPFSSEASLYVSAITASSRDATKDHLLFRTSKLTTGYNLSQKFVVPNYYQQKQQQRHYHYHYDGRAETNDNIHHEGMGKDTKGGCETTPKRSKKTKTNDNDTTTNCTTALPSSSKSKSPSIAPVTISDNNASPSIDPGSAPFLSPTVPPTLGKPPGTDNPSTTTNTPEQIDDDDGDSRSDYYFHLDLHDDLKTDVETNEELDNTIIHDDKNTVARGEGDPDESSNTISNRNTNARSYYWIIGAILCVTAYCGGLTTSRFFWPKKNDRGKRKNKGKRNRNSKNGSSFYNQDIGGNANDNTSGTNSGTSIQLSVEESVDSYYHDDDEVDLEAFEDWSMSVMSWSPRETMQDVIEVGPPSQTITDEPAATADTDADAVQTDAADARDEIEIEFEYDSPEGDFEDIALEPYVIEIDTDTNTDANEEDPPLFDVIDLSNGRIASF